MEVKAIFKKIESGNRPANLILLSILILAGILRLFRLSYQSLWLDEVLTVIWSQLNSVGQIISTLSVSDNSPPLYYIFLHFWMKLGADEFILRLPSAIAGLITVFFVYKIGELVYSKKAGLIGAFLISIAPMFIWISQEARMYSFLAMFSLVSFYYFIKATRENSTSTWAKYAFISVLALYTHYFAIFTFFAEFVYFLVNIKRFKLLKVKYFITLGVILLVYIPCIWFMLKQVSSSARLHQGLFSPTAWAIPHTFFELSVGYSLAIIELSNFSKNLPYNLTVLLFSGAIFSILFLYGLIWAIRFKKVLGIILCYLLIPVLVSYVVSFKIHVFGAKYLVGAAGAYFLILTFGLLNLKNRPLKVVLFAWLIAVHCFSLSNYYFNDNYAKGPWRDVAKLLESNAQKDDVILFVTGNTPVALEYYYRGGSRVVKSLKVAEAGIGAKLAGAKRVWFIPDMENIFDPTNLTRRYLDNSWVVQTRYQVRSMPVILYSIKTEGGNSD